ncbi:transmembrane amino acid transporter protein-domain-containing protein [Xylariaceae sp. FL0804]|nr:transmembrane amino acid transporter protein-domain-containing protein [Xylariaceae sp. FL0804]
MAAASEPGTGKTGIATRLEKTIQLESSSPAERPLHRPGIADYVYYAKKQRQAELDERQGRTNFAFRLLRFGQGTAPATSPADGVAVRVAADDEQTAGLSAAEAERVRAWRALRQASWVSALWLSTTDILGPFNAPYAFRVNGYVPGALLYVFMGGAATYCGALLWWLYVQLDSDRFPVKSYSDITERVAGRAPRVVVTWLVFIHMIVNIATTSLSSAQSLYQLAKGNICFVVAVVIWIIVGCLLNQIRTLKRYSWIASAAIWLNVLVILLSMGFIAHSPPNYAAASASYGVAAGPVATQRFATYPFYERINGVMNIVYAYGGATIFPQIIAEMRRPMDFLKAFAIAQAAIFTLYLVYGLYVYSFQGQFTLAVAFQGVSRYSWQTVGNVLSLVSGVIAGGLYGNIGLKIFYVNVVERLLGGPALLTARGRVCWTAVVLVFWWAGFAIGAGIPQVQTLSGMVGAVANMQFTYSFPTGFAFLYLVQLDAAAADEDDEDDDVNHDGGGGGDRDGPRPTASRRDAWRNWSRWRRGLLGARRRHGKKKQDVALQLFKWFNFWLCLAALATAGLGIYGSGLSIAAAFDSSAATSFGCSAPV